MSDFDVAIIGSGLVGLTLAKGLTDIGVKTALIAPQAPGPDGRTSALLADSIAFLQRLHLWEEAQAFAFPLKTMRIIDGTNRLVRAPQTDFKSIEINQEAFGYNMENRLLTDLINRHLNSASSLTRMNTKLAGIEQNTSDSYGKYEINTESAGDLTAKIVVACDGKNSMVRKALNIKERSWSYPQIALVGNFTHSFPNNDTSTEFHTETGPFTIVPLGKKRSSLVCVVDAQNAEHLTALESDALNRELERRMQSFLGKVKLETGLKQFPLSGMVAKRFAVENALLAGEAAHVFPPIGAQGLNLGMRDVAAILDLVSEIDFSADMAPANTIGDRYHQKRSADILARTASVDVLNRSLLSDFLPVQAGRSLGLYALNEIGPLRRLMMREGIAPGARLKNPFEKFRNRPAQADANNS